MPRRPREVLPNIPHHVTHRGLHHNPVFLDDADCQLYLALLRQYSTAAGVQILAYCLMGNHVHLVVVPPSSESLSAGIGSAHRRYALYHNERHGIRGSIWHGRFYSSPMDHDHLVLAVRYTEQNPVRARLVAEPWDYPWSSAAAHLGGEDVTGVLDLDAWRRRWPAATWRTLLARPVQRVRGKSGWALGDTSGEAR